MKIKRILCTLICIILLVSPVEVGAKTYISDSQIVSADTPVSAENTELTWSRKLGSSYKDAPSTQVVVDDTLIVMSGKKLLKLDAETGKTRSEEHTSELQSRI